MGRQNMTEEVNYERRLLTGSSAMCNLCSTETRRDCKCLLIDVQFMFGSVAVVSLSTFLPSVPASKIDAERCPTTDKSLGGL